MFSGLAAAGATLASLRRGCVVLVDAGVLAANPVAREVVEGLEPVATVVAHEGADPLALLDRVLAAADGPMPPWVVAVGGGLVLDVGRVAALLAADPLAGKELRRRMAVADGLLMWPADRHATAPAVCLPTTVGTAAEVSPIAVLRTAGRVVMLVCGGLRSRYAVLDAALTASLPAARLRAGLVEPLARLLVPAVVATPQRPQDDVAAALLRTLLDLGSLEGDPDAVWRTTAALASAGTHTSFVSLGRPPFGHVLWPLAMELASAAGTSKAAAMAALLPAWLSAVVDGRVSSAFGTPERVSALLGEEPRACVRRVTGWCEAVLPSADRDHGAGRSRPDAEGVAAAVERRWRAGGLFLVDVPGEDVRALLAGATGR